MIIDFNEIPKANTGTGRQDTFELFTRDFLESLGYLILEDPARGADGGMDLKVREVRHGINGQNTNIDWLVSCKHFSHSKKSIGTENENDILDRVKLMNCNGFLGFYSTLPSASLNKKFKLLSKEIAIQHFDSEKIESLITKFGSKENIFIRYFPESYKRWKEISNFKEPIKLFNYYVKKELKSEISILQNIFGTNEQILKALKSSTDFENFLLKSNVIIICDKDLNHHFNQLAKKYNQELKDLNLFEQLQEISKNYMPKLILEKHGVNVDNKMSLISMGFKNPRKIGYTLLYDNALLINDNAKKEISETYDKLLGILD